MQILIDGFYCAYRSAYAFKDLKTQEGCPSGIVFGFIRTLQSISQRWPSADLVVCWDAPSTWRREAYSGYKANRSGSKGVVDKTQLYEIARFCKAVGIPQAVSDGQEADDVIGSLLDPAQENIIYSRDRDFCQLVKDGETSVFSPKTGNSPEIIFNEARVFEKFGVYPPKLLMFRALQGDSSDNLPGLRRFPQKKIVELVGKHDTIEDLIESAHKYTKLTPHQKNVLDGFSQQGPLNFLLMKIRTDVVVTHIPGAFNRKEALDILNTFELKSLRSTISLFEDQGEPGLLGLFDFS